MQKKSRVNLKRKKISSLLVFIILISNLFPVVGVVFAEDDSSSTAPTEAVNTATPATADSSGQVSQTPQTALTPLTAPTQSLIPVQTMDTTTPVTSSTSDATDTISNTNTNSTTTDGTSTNPFLQNQTATDSTATDTPADNSATDTTASSTFNGTASTTNEFVAGGSTILGTTTASTSDVLATTTTICDPISTSTNDGATTDQTDNGCDTYSLGTSTLPAGTTTIKTGDAAVTANLLNILNTNLLNSTGTIKMVNLLNGTDGSLDLRNSSSAPATDTCTLLSCSGINSVAAKISSDASIDNALVLQAQSGSNTVDTVQNGTIQTGNTFAGLNLVNFANTNFVDSNYYLLSLNSFNTINGDIVLPGLATLFAKIAGMTTALGNINSNQLAETQNDLSINANTGNNATQNSLSSNTNTGNANSATNVYNNSNSNLIGGNSVQILLRVSGNWLGKLLGLPDGTQFIQDGNVRILQMDNGTTTQTSGTVTTVDSTSTAKIVNGVKMLSDTGNNLIANTENATIDTGNAFAAANIINVSNTNVIGKNWMLAIINIFGDLNGNIVFGRPDLKVSEQVNSPDAQINNGSILNYTLTIKNNGDAPASNVHINSNFDPTLLDITNTSMANSGTDAGKMQFDLGDLKPGDERVITFSANLKNTNPGQTITDNSVALADETDNNVSDNSDSASVATFSIAGGGGGGTIADSGNSVGNNSGTNQISQNPQVIYPNLNQNLQLTANNFSVSRGSASSTVTGLGKTSHQKITLLNNSNSPIDAVTFYDIMYDTNGNEMERQSWDLDTVKGNEEIDLDYDVTFGNQAVPGTYSLSSEIDYGSKTSPQKIVFDNNGKIAFALIDDTNLNQDLSLGTTTEITSSANISHPTNNSFKKPESGTQIDESPKMPPPPGTKNYSESIGGNDYQKNTNPKNIWYSALFGSLLVIFSLYLLLERKLFA